MSNLNDLLCRIIAGDPTAADEIEIMADRLREVARQMRKEQEKGGMNDPGGATDRVQINVIGPDGTIKQQVDTK